MSIFISACGSQPDYWEVTTKTEWIPSRIEIHVVGNEISQWCQHSDGHQSACASRDLARSTCHVYLRSTQNWRCNVRHEALRHCLGEDHPKYAYSMECARLLGESAF